MALVPRPGTEGLLLAERAGRVLPITVAGDGSLVAGEPLLDISAQVTTSGEGGLLGLAVSPTGDELYVSFTDTGWRSRIVAYRVAADGLSADQPRLLLTVDQPYRNHNGGHVLVDPAGRLLIGFGDGGSGGDPHGHGRDRTTLLGALLRIDPTPDGDSAYTVPANNPFADVGEAGTRPEILAFGLRNPWRFDLDPVSGDLWIADVGQDRVEEIDLLPGDEVDSGADFGWAAMEGSVGFDGPEPDGHVPPVHEYPNEGARCSVTGGVVVRGGSLGLLPGLEGTFLFSDLCDGRIRALLPDGAANWDDRDLGATVDLPVSFARSDDGTVYVLSLAGGVYRLDPD